MESKKIVRVRIPEETKKLCLSETVEDLKHISEKIKENYSFNKKFLGTLGQKCVEDFLSRNNVTFEIDNERRPGAPDRFDIKCGSSSIEVKTRSHSQDNVMIIPKRQIDRNIFDYYIGVKLNNSMRSAFIYGYAYSGEIRTAMLKQSKYGYWYHFPFVRLNPIMNLTVNLPKSG